MFTHPSPHRPPNTAALQGRMEINTGMKRVENPLPSTLGRVNRDKAGRWQRTLLCDHQSSLWREAVVDGMGCGGNQGEETKPPAPLTTTSNKLLSISDPWIPLAIKERG